MLPQAMWDSMDCKTPFWITRPRMWDPHFQLGHGSDTICNDSAPTVQILSALEPMPLTVLFIFKSHSNGGKGLYTLHIKGRSLFINTFSNVSLSDVGFHGLQNPLLDHYNICNDPRKSASYICAIPHKNQLQLRLLQLLIKLRSTQ